MEGKRRAKQDQSERVRAREGGGGQAGPEREGKSTGGGGGQARRSKGEEMGV